VPKARNWRDAPKRPHVEATLPWASVVLAAPPSKSEAGAGGRLRARSEGDDAAHDEVAENTRGTAARDFHDVEVFGGDAGPVDPAAEGIVEGDAVPENHCAAGAGGTQSAQGDALRAGIGDQAGGAAEETEPRQQAEAVVEVDAGRLGELCGGQSGEGSGGVGGDVFGDGDGGFERGDGCIAGSGGWVEAGRRLGRGHREGARQGPCGDTRRRRKKSYFTRDLGSKCSTTELPVAEHSC